MLQKNCFKVSELHITNRFWAWTSYKFVDTSSYLFRLLKTSSDFCPNRGFKNARVNAPTIGRASTLMKIILTTNYTNFAVLMSSGFETKGRFRSWKGMRISDKKATSWHRLSNTSSCTVQCLKENEYAHLKRSALVSEHLNTFKVFTITVNRLDRFKSRPKDLYVLVCSRLCFIYIWFFLDIRRCPSSWPPLRLKHNRVGALVQWLWDETHVLKVVGSNPNTVYLMNIFSHIFVVKNCDVC